MGYSKQIIKGFSWGAFLNAGALLISIVKIVILSHFIFGPAEFGVFGVGVLVLGVLELITETGINIFLVQERQPLTTYLDTAWVVSIARGALIAGVLALLSYPIALFFKIPAYWTFILAFSLIPLIRGFINPAIANLQKKLLFRQNAIYRFTVSVIEDMAILTLAILTHNIFSFIAGMLIGVIIEVTLTFIFVKERPKLIFDTSHLRKIIDRGKWVTLAQIFNYLFEHVDDVFVGRILNVFSLGIYQNSYTFASLPENAIAEQLGKVTFPIYVQFRDDKERLKRAFWRTFLIVFALVVPFGLIMFIFSDQAVHLILGDKWLAAIPVLRVLALFSVVRALTNLFYPLFLAFKKQKYVMVITFVSILMLGVTIVPLTSMYGISGAATAALIGSIAGLPVAFILFYRLFK